MNVMGLSQDQQQSIFSLLAGILHLGNVQFGDKNNYATVLSERGIEIIIERCFLYDNWIVIYTDLQAPCAYFGIQTDYLKRKLISKQLEFKKDTGPELIDQTFTVDKAIFTRDALAKSIYTRIFDHLIQVSNSHWFIFVLSENNSLSFFYSIRQWMQPFKQLLNQIYVLVFLISMVLKSLNVTVLNNFVLIMLMKNFNKSLLS